MGRIDGAMTPNALLRRGLYLFVSGLRPTTSVGGIVWLTATLIAMLLLAGGKGVAGRQLGNPVLQTESHVTLIDALLAAVLSGLVLNALLGWWWADPLSGLVIVYYALTRAGPHGAARN